MKQKAPSEDRAFIERCMVLLSSTPDRTRTCDILLRRQMLYPAELPGHFFECKITESLGWHLQKPPKSFKKPSSGARRENS